MQLPAWVQAGFRGSSIEDMRYAGFAGGHVITDRMDDAFVGASIADSLSAGISAFLWAMLHVIACVTPGVAHGVMYDSECINTGATAESSRIPYHVDFCHITTSFTIMYR